MNEQSMLNQLAENAGLSFLELKGFYDTVKEKGQADEEDMKWLCNLSLPVEFTFHMMQLPPPIGATVPFDILGKVFEKMAHADMGKVNSESDRYFIVTYMIFRNGQFKCQDWNVVTKGGEYINRVKMVDLIGREEGIHPSLISIWNIIEMNKSDFDDFTKQV